MAKPDCVGVHSTLDMTSGMLTNFEAFISLKAEVFKLRDPVRSKVVKTIQERKDVQIYLDRVLASLKATEADVVRLKEENDSMVAELSSLMETGLLSDFKSKEEENDTFLNELLPFLTCQQAGSKDSVKEKIKESFKVFILRFEYYIASQLIIFVIRKLSGI